MELISIIVPVFNVREYLDQCLMSILRQTYHLFEVIIVDDGSDDGSIEICQNYQNRDSRIKVIHQLNGGPSKARNTGLKACRGKYCTFVDADDILTETYLSDLYFILTDADADIAMCGYERVYNTIVCSDSKMIQDNTMVLSGLESLESMLYRKDISSYVWGKLYKTEVFQLYSFPEGKVYEDLRILSQILPTVGLVAYNPVINYFYYQRKGSLIHRKFEKNMMDQVTASEEILEMVAEKYPTIRNAAISKVFLSSVDVYRKIPLFSKYCKEKECLENNIKYYRKIVLKDKKNKLIERGIALVSCCSIQGLRICCIVAGKIRLNFGRKSI